MKRKIIIRKYLTEDNHIEVYLEEVSGNRSDKLCAVFKRIMDVMLLIYTSIFITIPFAIFLCCTAYMERGYKGYGGEWVFIMVIFLIIIKIIKNLKKG